MRPSEKLNAYMGEKARLMISQCYDYLEDKEALKTWNEFCEKDGRQVYFKNPKLMIPHEYLLNMFMVREDGLINEAAKKGCPKEISVTAWVNSMCCWVGWEKYRTVYKVNKNLWQHMEKIPYPSKYPARQINLPAHFTVLCFDSDKNATSKYFGIYFDQMAKETGEGYELRFNELIDGEWVFLMSLQIGLDDTVEDATNRIKEKNLSNLDKGKSFPIPIVEKILGKKAIENITPGSMNLATEFMLKNYLKPAINLLFYMDGNDDIKYRPNKKHKGKRKIRNSKNRDAEVGSKFDFCFRGLREVSFDSGENSKSEKTGIKQKPHIRKFHTRTYWTGKGRVKPVLRFISEYATGGYSVDELKKMIEEKRSSEGLSVYVT